MSIAILGIGLFVGGIIFGTQLSIIWQATAFVAYIFYMKSDHVRYMEIGAIIPMLLGIVFFIGVL